MERMTREKLRGKAQTVLGPVDPAALGPTLMHEHVLWDIRTPGMKARPDQGPEITLETAWGINYGTTLSPLNFDFGSQFLDVATAEVAAMRDAGGRSIVELTCGGLRPEPEGLVRISHGTGVHIVMGCGFYVDEYQDPADRGRSADSFARQIVDQVQLGAWGTPVRAGMIGEIGCQAPWTEHEKTVMRGAVAAQRETGAALNVHPGRHPDQPQEAAEFIREAGGDLARTVISHIDRTIFDLGRLLRLADTGATLEFDLFGQESSFYKLADIDMPNDATRLAHIRALVDRGHLDRVVISHDICYRSRLARFGGHGYGHIFANVVPMMRRRGYSEDEIDAILVRNPSRLLTFA